MYVILHYRWKNVLDRTAVYNNLNILVGFSIKEFLLKVSASISSLQLFRSINLHKTLNCPVTQTSFDNKDFFIT